MQRLELFDFQQEVAEKLATNAIGYYANGPDRLGGRNIPFVGQLKAVTGAGKTPILADVVGRFQNSIVLWTTKYGSVVDQTLANLRTGGKYHHLLAAKSTTEVLRLSDVSSYSQWRGILERDDGLTVLVSSVAAWNSSEKDDRLNVHRVGKDWGETSRWEQLKNERKRPLWVVYDEAHNTTAEQVELLDELDPLGFFVASASPLRGTLQRYLTNLPEAVRNERIVPVHTRAVVDAQLLKSTISLTDYDGSTEGMISDVVTLRQSLEEKHGKLVTPVVPKAIYVVETSNVSGKDAEARPVTIWTTLINKCGVPAEKIAVCTNTKNLPKDAVQVATIDQLSDEYTHIIFNKKLQEGWDDPSVYVCYFDGRTESATRLEQVVGRALRQPRATHFVDEDLNTAYFYVNCPSEKLEDIVDELKQELRIYRSEDDAEDFEPFQIKEARRAPARIPIKTDLEGKLRVPKLQAELPAGNMLSKLIERKTYDFSEEDRRAPGKALVNIVSVRTGDLTEQSRDLLEDMRVACGDYLQGQIRILSRNCANSIHPSVFNNDQLNKSACYRSKALEHYRQLAIDVVREYENHVQLRTLVDLGDAEYIVGDYQVTGDVGRDFENAGHLHYDTRLNQDELLMAKALDKFSEHVWVRNKERSGYGIPLPVKSGSSSTFYPDFLWWVGNTIWAIDPTGKFILEEKVRTKLLIMPDPLRVALVTAGKLDNMYKKISEEGWTLVRHRIGNLQPECFDSLDDLLSTLVEQSHLDGARP